jgi:hypothetical protein
MTVTRRCAKGGEKYSVGLPHEPWVLLKALPEYLCDNLSGELLAAIW